MGERDDDEEEEGEEEGFFEVSTSRIISRKKGHRKDEMKRSVILKENQHE